MSLSSDQVSGNYKLCYQLTEQMLKQRFHRRGRETDYDRLEFVDLCQSVVGHERIVLLLQHEKFSTETYQPVLDEVIDEVKRLFFPDTCKKRFISLDALDRDFLRSNSDAADGMEDAVCLTDDIFSGLKKILSPESFQYLKNRLFPRLPDWEVNLQFWIRSARLNGKPGQQNFIERKISLLRKFYPDGKVCFTGSLNGLEQLSEDQIVQAFLNVYIGIERAFPTNFLQRDGEKRCGILVRFLIERILDTHPEIVLEEKNETFFIQNNLQNVYRFFNYSANRVLRNAYPERIPPWLHSRSGARYWEEEQNRTGAIRWLMEQRLGISPREFYKHSIPKEVFANHGLSYMFNGYYNSVSRAIAAAYPYLAPWEIGKVPFDYWTDENSGRAVRWMVSRKGWRVEDLPAKVNSKELTRKTFSQFGLATLFEKKFSRNIYRTLSAGWPGRFQPWELGKVSSEYWEHKDNIYHASKWIAEREGWEENEIPGAIRKKRLTSAVLKKYSIGSVLKRLCRGKIERIFAPLFWREHKVFLEEHKLLRKISVLTHAEKKNSLLHFLLYGLFFHDVQQSSVQNISRYQRIAHRIQRRSIAYTE